MNRDDARGPVLDAPPAYLELRKLIRSRLGFPDFRHPILIGIDGIDGSGKSSVAAWLSWQLEMPALHLDIYLIQNSDPLAWDVQGLAHAIAGAQLKPKARPVLVEGIFLLKVLESIGLKPEFLVFVEKEEREIEMQSLESYFKLYNPRQRADFILHWSSAEYDRRVTQAHIS